jgi:Arc/MetJ family transcription regulator
LIVNVLQAQALIHIKCDNIHIVRTNIDIDDQLMTEALRRSGAPTKRAAVEEGLRLLIQTKRQSGIRRLRGKVRWEGDLDAMRSGRTPQ